MYPVFEISGRRYHAHIFVDPDLAFDPRADLRINYNPHEYAFEVARRETYRCTQFELVHHFQSANPDLVALRWQGSTISATEAEIWEYVRWYALKGSRPSSFFTTNPLSAFVDDSGRVNAHLYLTQPR